MKATRKLIPAMAMLIVSAIVMSTASFAWFTMSREVTANGMNVTVTAPNNLLITGTDDSGVYSAVGNSTTAAGIGKIIPASTVNGLSFFAIKNGQSVTAATGTRNDDTKLEAANTAATKDEEDGAIDGYYVDFTYTVKTEGNLPVDVYVKSLTVTKHDGYTGDEDGLKAVRAAVLNSGGTALNTGVTRAVVLPAGYKYANTNQPGESVPKAVSKIDTNEYAELGEVLSVANTADAANKVFSLSANGSLAITIRVWIEGEDLSCNVTDAANLNFDVALVLADVANG